jgi:hypothetical protein
VRAAGVLAKGRMFDMPAVPSYLQACSFDDSDASWVKIIGHYVHVIREQKLVTSVQNPVLNVISLFIL